MQENLRTKLINVSQLLLDPENPRLASVQDNNHDTIRAMTKVQGERVLVLAQHLVENGSNPASLMIVIPTENDRELFYVLDGNRRLTALKLMESPLLAEGILNRNDLQTLKKLSKRFEENPLRSITCAVFDSRVSADPWIQLIHRGLNKGAGMLPWDGQVGARYDERRKKQKNIALQLLDFTKKYGSLSQEAQSKIEDGKFPITTFTRILSTPYIRKKLGIEKEKENVIFLFPKEEIAKGLSRIIEDLASSKVTVSDLKNQKQRIDYINNVGLEELPNESLKLSKPTLLGELSPTVSSPEIKNQRGDAPSKAESPNSEESDKSVSLSTEPQRSQPTPFPKRKSLIPKSCKITITQKRISALFKELKKLDIEEHPNAGAVMLRVFIELSVDHFVDKELAWNEQKIGNSTLNKKLSAVVKFMKNNNAMTTDELAPIQKAVDGDGMLAASVKSMNQYVHNRYYSPVPSELIVVWDDFQSFICNIWDVAK